MARRRGNAAGAASYKKDWFLSAEATLIQLIGLFSAIILYFAVVDDPIYTSMGRGTLKFMIFFASGLMLQFASNVLRFGTIKISIRWDIAEKTPAQKNTIYQFAFSIISLFIIQIIASLLTQTELFQVTEAQVYAYYVLAAVSEEALFRGGIISVVIVFLDIYGKSRNIRRSSEMQRQIHELCLNKTFQGTVGILVSSAIFGIAHVSYWNYPVLIFGTLLSGVILGISFVQSKGNLLITIFSHVVINAGNAKSIVQTLKKIRIK
jgi:hypothetical protein